MGFLYIFVNEWMPKLVKIGITDDLEKRLKQSAGTGGDGTFIPCAFSCYYAVKSDQNDKLEKFLHQVYDKFRINDRREFFELSPAEAKKTLQGLIALGVATEIDDKETETISDKIAKELDAEGQQKILRKRPRTTFRMLGIKQRSELVYKGDNAITCITSDDENNVEFKGVERTISNVSSELTGCPSNGFENFLYNGKILGDIRREMESE